MTSEPERALACFAADHHSVFRRADAVRAGLSDAQIRRRVTGTWTALFDGVFRMPGAARSWHGDALAAIWAAGAGSAISHRCAAEFYEVPGRRRYPIELTCQRWARMRVAGVRAHEGRRLPASDITELAGIPVVTPELLVLQLAWCTPRPNYVESVIHALRRKRLISFSSMEATFVRHARRGLRGIAATRRVLEVWNPAGAPTDSEMETLLVQTLRAHDLPEPIIQFVVLDDQGRFVARADAGLPQWRITIEYESMQEHLDEFQLARDARRRNQVLAAGYFPLTARIGDLRDGGHQLAQQIRTIARRQSA